MQSENETDLGNCLQVNECAKHSLKIRGRVGDMDQTEKSTT